VYQVQYDKKFMLTQNHGDAQRLLRRKTTVPGKQREGKGGLHLI